LQQLPHDAALVKAGPLQIVSPEEFWDIDRGFHRAYEAREGHLPLEEQTANYDERYDALIRHLSAIGTLAEGDDDGSDFSTYRYVPPAGVITVICSTETIFRLGATDAALAAIHESRAPFMVCFDTGSYIGVLPDGRVVGFSECEDLTPYTDEPFG
jgi:hypothetical protein